MKRSTYWERPWAEKGNDPWGGDAFVAGVLKATKRGLVDGKAKIHLNLLVFADQVVRVAVGNSTTSHAVTSDLLA